MASTRVNVLRYSALGSGLLYGIYHQAKLSSAAKLSMIDREYEHKQSLIEQAKVEYAKNISPHSAKEDIVRDPNNPKFNLEALLKDVARENP